MKRSAKKHTADVPRSASNGEWGCNGKRQFGTFSEADRIATRVRRNVDGEHTAPYLCRHCRKFHIGSAGIPQARSKRKAHHDRDAA